MDFRPFLPVLFLISLFRANAQETVLLNGHAHNDYKQEHPLHDALKFGFASVEADIFLKGGQLIVSHTRPLMGKGTLEELYLDPLEKIFREKGKIYDNASLILLIDVKTNERETYGALRTRLERYRYMLTRYEAGIITPGAVTVIITGNKPKEGIGNECYRYAFIDQSLLNLETTAPPGMFLMASTKYSNVLSWKGKGEIVASEKNALCRMVATAHQQGKKVRLWASPENTEVWKFLLDCGVDLINTDQLKKLSDFLKER